MSSLKQILLPYFIVQSTLSGRAHHPLFSSFVSYPWFFFFCLCILSINSKSWSTHKGGFWKFTESLHIAWGGTAEEVINCQMFAYLPTCCSHRFTEILAIFWTLNTPQFLSSLSFFTCASFSPECLYPLILPQTCTYTQPHIHAQTKWDQLTTCAWALDLSVDSTFSLWRLTEL